MLTTTLLLAASMVVGQADGQEAFEAFSEFVVEGTWTYTIPDGRVGKDCYRKILDGKFIELNGKHGDLELVCIIGVDPKSKLCTWWGFGNENGVGKVTMELESQGVWKPYSRMDDATAATASSLIRGLFS